MAGLDPAIHVFFHPPAEIMESLVLADSGSEASRRNVRS
jgi:hypothetical protein